MRTTAARVADRDAVLAALARLEAVAAEQARQGEALAMILRLLERGERTRRPTSALSRADRALLARLLPVLGATFGSEPFTSRDLPNASPGLRLVLRGLSVKQIGRLLARAEGTPVDGWIVERCGTEINVLLWRVLAAVSQRLETGPGRSPSGSILAGDPDA